MVETRLFHRVFKANLRKRSTESTSLADVVHALVLAANNRQIAHAGCARKERHAVGHPARVLVVLGGEKGLVVGNADYGPCPPQHMAFNQRSGPRMKVVSAGVVPAPELFATGREVDGVVSVLFYLELR